MEQQQVTPENLKLIREHYKLTISEMADKLGMSKRNYEKYEKGEFEVGERLRLFIANRLDHLGFDLVESPLIAQITEPNKKPKRKINIPIKAYWAKLSEGWRIAIVTTIISTLVAFIILIITLKYQK